MPTPGVVCPHCGCQHVVRSHRRSMEKPFLRLFHVIPYRCDVCERRFYRRGPESSPSLREAAFTPKPAARSRAVSTPAEQKSVP